MLIHTAKPLWEATHASDSPAGLCHQQRGMHLVQRQADKAQHGVHQSQQLYVSFTTGMNAIFHFQPTPFLFNIAHLKWRVDTTGVLVMLCQPRPTLLPALGTCPGRRKKNQQLFRKMFPPTLGLRSPSEIFLHWVLRSLGWLGPYLKYGGRRQR